MFFCQFNQTAPFLISVVVDQQLHNPTFVMSISSYIFPVRSCPRFPSFTIRKACYSSFSSHITEGRSLKRGESKHIANANPLFISNLSNSTRCQFVHVGLSSSCRNRTLSLRPKYDVVSRSNWSMRPIVWTLGASLVGAFVCFSSLITVYAEAGKENDNESDKSSSSSSDGKKIYKDYTVTGIPGDGRCLFRSVAHGACIRLGKSVPDENLQRKLADELREQVADELLNRRTETEWFIEGDFDSYVSHIRKQHVWGGEPELLMASHVLKMPITVYMHNSDLGGLIAIAEYGQEYGKENPIRVLYHGYGHYDALQIPAREGLKSRL